jgi:hypothetical protein
MRATSLSSDAGRGDPPPRLTAEFIRGASMPSFCINCFISRFDLRLVVQKHA